MKKLVCFLLTAILVLGLVACGDNAGQTQSENTAFQIGFGRVDITPEVGTQLAAGGTGLTDRICVVCVFSLT